MLFSWYSAESIKVRDMPEIQKGETRHEVVGQVCLGLREALYGACG